MLLAPMFYAIHNPADVVPQDLEIIIWPARGPGSKHLHLQLEVERSFSLKNLQFVPEKGNFGLEGFDVLNLG